MSDIPTNAFVPREEQASVIAAAMAAVRRTEGERTWGILIGRLSGWFVAAGMVVMVGYEMTIIKDIPVPKDRIWVSMIHTDGRTDEAKPIEDMTAGERENAMSQFAYEYVTYRMNYSASDIQYNYNRTRFITYGKAQEAYIDEMTLQPNRPTEALGTSGERHVTVGVPNRTGECAFDVPFDVSVRTREGVVMPTASRIARISCMVLAKLPTDIARRLDPLKLVVTGWHNDPAKFDPTAPGGDK